MRKYLAVYGKPRYLGLVEYDGDIKKCNIVTRIYVMPKYLLPQDELSRASDWISNFLMREGYHADYTIESLFEIDKFFK